MPAAYYCDRCDTLVRFTGTFEVTDDDGERWRLCSPCMNGLRRWFRNLAKIVEKGGA